MRNVYKILVGKGKKPLRRRRHTLEDNIKMGVKHGARVWTVLNWLRIRTGGGLL
jgi:hypothetical protein